jgi:hypothetical protein
MNRAPDFSGPVFQEHLDSADCDVSPDPGLIQDMNDSSSLLTVRTPAAVSMRLDLQVEFLIPIRKSVFRDRKGFYFQKASDKLDRAHRGSPDEDYLSR